MKRWMSVLAGTAMLGSLLASSAYASPSQQWRGVDQDFVLDWKDGFVIGEDPCEVDTPKAGYVSNGLVSGSLYLRGCDRADTTTQLGRSTFSFIDTTGTERCMGEVSFAYNAEGTAATSTWKIENPVPSFECRSAGQTVQLNIYRTRAEPVVGG